MCVAISSNEPLRSVARKRTSASGDDYSDAEQVIRRHCKQAYPDDYNMRNFCTKQQREALVVLKQGRPRDIPEEEFAQIRNKVRGGLPGGLHHAPVL